MPPGFVQAKKDSTLSPYRHEQSEIEVRMSWL
jgi:hypothetical protein